MNLNLTNDQLAYLAKLELYFRIKSDPTLTTLCAYSPCMAFKQWQCNDCLLNQLSFTDPAQRSIIIERYETFIKDTAVEINWYNPVSE